MASSAKTSLDIWSEIDPKRKSARPTVAAAIQAKADMRIVAFTTEASPVQRILTHIGEPAEPPPIVRARGPPVWDDGLDSLPDWDAIAQQEPEYMFNQEVALVAPRRKLCRRRASPCTHAALDAEIKVRYRPVDGLDVQFIPTPHRSATT